MPSRKLHCAWLLASLTIAGIGTQPAGAQGRVQATPTPPPPPPPGLQKPDFDPTHQALSALSIKLDGLRQALGRQVVVLHFTPTESGTWTKAMNTAPLNNQRAEFKCTQALGDRYGRVLSRSTATTGDMWYFSHVICETKP